MIWIKKKVIEVEAAIDLGQAEVNLKIHQKKPKVKKVAYLQVPIVQIKREVNQIIRVPTITIITLGIMKITIVMAVVTIINLRTLEKVITLAKVARLVMKVSRYCPTSICMNHPT